MKIAVTGGHHTSALPVIDSYLKTGEVSIVWFGHRHSMRGNKNDTLEYLEITERQIPFIDLKAGKFYKTYNPFRLAKIPFGFLQAFFELLHHRPDVILSFGGYLAVPVVIAGKLLGIPSITHEQTVVTGYANKLISKFADKVLISHEESRAHFPAEKTVYSGMPLRKSLFEVRSNSFNFDNDLPVLYITAGKTGSHIINEVVRSCLKSLLQDFNVIHQCGDHSVFKDYEKLSNFYESLASEVPGKYYLRRFVLDDEIGEVFRKADLLLTRSGAHTTYEIKTFGIPSVLVPIPWVSHQEQLKNARTVEQAGLGLILEESDLTSERLFAILREALETLPSRTSFPEYNNSAEEIIKNQVAKVYAKKK